MENKVKIYEIVVDYDDDETGMLRNSFVDDPAVEYTKISFSKETKILQFNENKSEQKFMSVSMIADTPIPRRHPVTGEVFGIVFSKDTIKKIVNKLVMQNKINEVSFQHTDEIIEDVFLVEHFFVEKGRVESPVYKDVPEGSWITTYWVKDTDTYNRLLEDETFNGFSIEINAEIEQVFSNCFTDIEEYQIKTIQEIVESEDSDESKEAKIKNLLDIKDKE